MPEAPIPPADGANADEIPPAVPIAPPTQAGALAVGAGPPAWPKVMGVISIVLGAGGVLLGIWSVVAMLMPPVSASCGTIYSTNLPGASGD